MTLSETSDPAGQFERRTLLKATAWGGAAVVFSIAAPAASASPSDASGWAVAMSMTSGPMPATNTATTLYEWSGTSNLTQPKVSWTDAGQNTWSTGTMKVTYVIGKNSPTKLTGWTGCTPYKLDSATRYNAANVSTNSAALAQNDIVGAFDGGSWTCVSISQSGTGVNLQTTVIFTSNSGYTSQPQQVNTVYLPRLGVKLDFTLTYTGGTANAGKPFAISATWEPDQTNQALLGIKAIAGPSF